MCKERLKLLKEILDVKNSATFLLIVFCSLGAAIFKYFTIYLFGL